MSYIPGAHKYQKKTNIPEAKKKKKKKKKKRKRYHNAKLSAYYFYVKTKISLDSQTCISVSLIYLDNS